MALESARVGNAEWFAQTRMVGAAARQLALLNSLIQLGLHSFCECNRGGEAVFGDGAMSTISLLERMGSEPTGGYNAGDALLSEVRWYAVCVGSRQEKAVVRHLEMSGLTGFLPLYRSVRRWRDRRKQVEMVLFPGYVFVNLDLRNRLRVLTIPGVLRFVSFQGHPAPIRDAELEPLARVLGQGSQAAPHPYLRKGRRVRVVRGALADSEGILVRRREGFRLVLSIDLIERSMTLDVDECDCEPVG